MWQCFGLIIMDRVYATHSPTSLGVGVVAGGVLVATLLYSFAKLLDLPEDKASPPAFKVSIIKSSIVPKSVSLLPSNTPISNHLPRSWDFNIPASDRSESKQAADSKRPTKNPVPQEKPPGFHQMPSEGLTVFDPRLRATLKQFGEFSPQSYHKPITETYEMPDGELKVEHNGRCFTLRDNASSPTGKLWSLPEKCFGVKDESERIAEGLRAAMKRRFGEERK